MKLRIAGLIGAASLLISAPVLAATKSISYNGSSFTSGVTLTAGDTLIVNNDSNTTLDFESNPHPAHTANPQLNFGQISAHSSMGRVLTTVGTWGFHNHPQNSATGQLTVVAAPAAPPAATPPAAKTPPAVTKATPPPAATTPPPAASQATPTPPTSEAGKTSGPVEAVKDQTMVKSNSVAIPLAIGAVVILALVGVLVWFRRRSRQRLMPPTDPNLP